jgi:hypothetical protein
MKKILILIIGGFITFGCSEDLLDITPQDQLSDDVVWANAATIELFVNAQYGAILNGFTAPPAITGIANPNTDLQYNGFEGWRENASNINSYWQGTLSKDNVPNSINSNWNRAYGDINNLNIFFSKIGDAPVSAIVKGNLIDQMKFIRAFTYFQLLRNYGGVPIIEKPYGLTDTWTGATRASFDQTKDYIIKDLDDVINNTTSGGALPNTQTGSNFGRASKDAARALKSRVLLYVASPLFNTTNDMVKWQAAADAADYFVNGAGKNSYPLSTNYGDIWRGTTGNSEIIFGKFYNVAENHNRVFFTLPPSVTGFQAYTPSQNLVDSYEMQATGQLPVTNSTTGAVNPTSGYNPAQPYVGRDPRFYATVATPGTKIFKKGVGLIDYELYVGGFDYQGNDRSRTGYNLIKHYDPLSPSLPAGTQDLTYTPQWIHFRTAELILNYAEAQIMLGNEILAKEALNRLRTRVSMPAITETGAALLARCKRERKVELSFEGHYFYDIRRWKDAPAEYGKPIIRITTTRSGSAGAYTYTYARSVVQAAAVWNDRLYLAPIAFTEINASGGSLVQNPGY